ncbi:acyl transferase/acyl hydrolase/lysophospholipase [Lyophyllum atratum]|nr:acyl transferase/acyl hydrolase/lysophospholipase [Lyophyllum atratum]
MSSEESGGHKGDGLRLLSLDGSGIRGISELVILKEIMHRIQAEERLEETPLPCQYFDMIGGTSTGGLITLMLGRLGMSVEEAIRAAYVEFARTVFSTKKRFSQHGTFKASALEEAIKEIIFKYEGDQEAHMRTENPLTSCKTFDCKIWEAARATSAAPTFFKRISIGEEGMKEDFIDGGLRCNNPLAQVIDEAQLVFGERKVTCIVSGTGHPGTIGLKKPDAFQRMLPTDVISALRKIATDCEEVSEEIQKRFEKEPTAYFRFNVQQGLQDVSLAEWEKLAEVKTHTDQYLAETLVGRNINEVRDMLRQNVRLSTRREKIALELTLSSSSLC